MAGNAWQQKSEVHCYIVLIVRKQNKLNADVTLAICLLYSVQYFRHQAHGRMQPTFRIQLS